MKKSQAVKISLLFQMMSADRHGQRGVDGKGDARRLQWGGNERGDHPLSAIDEQLHAFLIQQQPQGQYTVFYFRLHMAGVGDIPM